jgi:hypothetical protein
VLRNPRKPLGTHQKILDVLKSAFDTLPDEDVSGIPEGPPRATLASNLSGNLFARQTTTVTGAAYLYVSHKEAGDIGMYRSDSGYGGEGASTSQSGDSSRPPHKRSSQRAMRSAGSDSGYGGAQGASTATSQSGGGSRPPHKRSSQRGAMRSVGSDSGYGGEEVPASASRSGGGSRSPSKRSSRPGGAMRSESGYGGRHTSTSAPRSGGGSHSPNKRSSQQSAMQDAALPSSKRRRDNGLPP